ncbi:MAG: hypothetical protein ACK5F4_08345 [Ignavibacteria bacterium]|jgi:hypothetical protein
MLKSIKYHIFLIGLFCTFSNCIIANTNNIPVNISDEYAPQGVESACNPDCPETPFPPVQHWLPDVLITLPNGCQVFVQYTTRFACNMWHDLYIARITAANSNDPICNNYFSTTGAAQIMADVTIQMLKQNPMGFPPSNNGECESNWRVIKGACWQKLNINWGSVTQPNQAYRLYPCLGDICCLDRYQVCLIGQERVITSLPGGVQGTCIPQETQPHSLGCEVVCGNSSSGGGGN